MKAKMKFIIIIPAYNEEKRIASVLKDVKKYKLPIIVVDDGSTDNTYAVAKKARAIVLRHRVNLGKSKGAALKTGVEAAFRLGADAVILLDSDGQHKARDLPKFIKALESGKYDIVFGSRNLSHGVPLIRFLGNKFASVLVSFLFNIYISDIPCGYKAFTKKAYKKIVWESVGYGVETEIAIRAGSTGLRRCEVSVATVYYDKYKGTTIFDAINILFDVVRWRIKL